MCASVQRGHSKVKGEHEAPDQANTRLALLSRQTTSTSTLNKEGCAAFWLAALLLMLFSSQWATQGQTGSIGQAGAEDLDFNIRSVQDMHVQRSTFPNILSGMCIGCTAVVVM